MFISSQNFVIVQTPEIQEFRLVWGVNQSITLPLVCLTVGTALCFSPLFVVAVGTNLRVVIFQVKNNFTLPGCSSSGPHGSSPVSARGVNIISSVSVHVSQSVTEESQVDQSQFWQQARWWLNNQPNGLGQLITELGVALQPGRSCPAEHLEFAQHSSSISVPTPDSWPGSHRVPMSCVQGCSLPIG